jgi:hypothetical protein
MSRPAHRAMVLLFASIVMFASVSDELGVLNDALERSMLWSRLLLLTSRDVTWAFCVVLGGVFANSTPLAARLGPSRAQ